MKFIIFASVLFFAPNVFPGDEKGKVVVTFSNDQRIVESRFKTDDSLIRIFVDRSGEKWAISGNIAMDFIPPVANAGDDFSATVGAQVILNGAGSYDPLGKDLTFKWYFKTRPTGSKTMISSPLTAKCTFVPDLPGSYTLNLNVYTSDHRNAMDDVTVTVDVLDLYPHAQISGENQVCGDLPQEIELDGSGSVGNDYPIICYNWAIESKPAGSAAKTVNGNEDSISFQADAAGLYRVSLTVENNIGYVSDKAIHEIRVTEGEGPAIACSAERQTFRTLFLSADKATLRYRLRYGSDCKKSPACYAIFRKCFESEDYSLLSEIESTAVEEDDSGDLVYTYTDSFVTTGSGYRYLFVSLDENGAVLTYNEAEI